jgi:hypothetical protein
VEGLKGRTISACAEDGHVEDIPDRHPTTVDARCPLSLPLSKSYGAEPSSGERPERLVQAISSHVVMNFDVAAENFGRAEFGLGRNEAYPMF